MSKPKTAPGTNDEQAALGAWHKENSNMSAKPDRNSEQPAKLAEKDPEDWVTGDETMTGPQASYLKTLCHEAGVSFDPGLTKAEASQLIEQLQAKTGRGRDH